MTDKIDLVLAALERLQADVTTLKGDVAALKDDVATLKGDVAALQADMRALHGRVDRLEAKIDRQPDLTIVLRSQDRLMRDMQAVKADVFELRAAIMNVARTMATHGHVEELFRAHLSLSARLDMLESRGDPPLQPVR